MKRSAPAFPRILLVDDHDRMRRTLAEAVAEAFPGCRVAEASSGGDALESCRRLPPDLVVMDMSMPGMNGVETTLRLRSEFPGIKIIMHSNFDAQPYRDEAARAGASAFIPKAASPASLLAAITEHLGQD